MIVAMVALVAADNSVDTLKESMSRKENLGAVEVCDGIGMNLMRRKTKMSSRTMLKKIWSSSIFLTALGARQSFLRKENLCATSKLVTTGSCILFKNK